MNLTISSLIKSKKLFYSLISQFVTLGVSLMMTIGVTKFLSVESFGYWQLFIFYSSYIGLAHFGLSDGLYLKYGGKLFTDLDKKEIKGILKFVIFFQLVIGFIIFLYALFSTIELERKFILYAISILVLITNFQTIFSYILLSTNKIIENSISVFIEKLSLLLFITCLIVIKHISFENLIFSYFLSKILSLIYLSTHFKSFVFVKAKLDYLEVYNIMKTGVFLMLSNIASTLIIGVSRYFIDEKWDIEIFGKISLAISLVYFVLILLSQVSFLLFPYLRNISKEAQKKVFFNLNKKLSIALKVCILLYLPFTFILYKILPNYEESINYLILLLPICLFDGKMQIIYTSYFKNLFLQKKLLYINLISLVISTILTLIGVYYFDSLIFILIGIVVSIMFRSILAEIILQRNYNISNYKLIIFDIIFSLIVILYYFEKHQIIILIKNFIYKCN